MKKYFLCQNIRLELSFCEYTTLISAFTMNRNSSLLNIEKSVKQDSALPQRKNYVQESVASNLQKEASIHYSSPQIGISIRVGDMQKEASISPRVVSSTQLGISKRVSDIYQNQIGLSDRVLDRGRIKSSWSFRIVRYTRRRLKFLNTNLNAIIGCVMKDICGFFSSPFVSCDSRNYQLLTL